MESKHPIVTCSVESVKEALSYCYDSLDDRAVVNFQPHEVYLFVGNRLFTSLLKQILLEIYLLENEGAEILEAFKEKNVFSEQVPTLSDALLQYVKSRGYLLPFDLDSASCFSLYSNRLALAHECLVDLMTCRMLKKKRLNKSLMLNSDKQKITFDLQNELFQGLKKVSDLVEELLLKPMDDDKPVKEASHHLLPEDISAPTEGHREGAFYDENTAEDAASILQEILAKLNKLSEQKIEKLRSLTEKLPEDSDTMNTVRYAVEAYNEEYNLRRVILLRRMHITVNAMLLSDYIKGNEEEIAKLIDSTSEWTNELARHDVLTWNIMLPPERASLGGFKYRISSSNPSSSPIKKLTIGEVPFRGGIVEDFTQRDIKKDVEKANIALRQKSGGGREQGRGGNFNSGFAQQKGMQYYETPKSQPRPPSFPPRDNYMGHQVRYDNNLAPGQRNFTSDYARFMGEASNEPKWSQRGPNTRGRGRGNFYRGDHYHYRR